jgi:hypothetical protein
VTRSLSTRKWHAVDAALLRLRLEIDFSFCDVANFIVDLLVIDEGNNLHADSNLGNVGQTARIQLHHERFGSQVKFGRRFHFITAMVAANVTAQHNWTGRLVELVLYASEEGSLLDQLRWNITKYGARLHRLISLILHLGNDFIKRRANEAHL